MPECLTYAFHKRPYAPPCGHCPACLEVAPIEPPAFTARPEPEPASDPSDDLDDEIYDEIYDETDEDEEMADASVEIAGGEGGWYDIVVDGESVDRVRGREAAEARAAELAEGDVPEP